MPVYLSVLLVVVSLAKVVSNIRETGCFNLMHVACLRRMQGQNYKKKKKKHGTVATDLFLRRNNLRAPEPTGAMDCYSFIIFFLTIMSQIIIFCMSMLYQ